MTSAQRWNDKEYWAKAWATLSWIGDRPPPTDGRDYRVQAEEAWKQGNALKAGRLIFENRPPDERPGWAAAILRLVLDRSGIERAEDQAGWVARVLGFHRCAVNLSTFKQVLDTAENSEQWANGHRAFDRLRREVLVLENVARTRRLTKEEQTHQAVLLLAELVAKVSYNATNPSDSFDHDSGWWIAACVRDLVDLWRDEEFSRAAWLALCSEVR